ncbi:hypothetical protein [Acetobacter tropicalis]|uniref:hypothetical protein n=1 Tax=Acetobacter tropicalis TaxID=104102 RepID=UPI0018D2D8B6|nr:hypothetical protein [Acetobacter tropicalis]
MAAAITPARKAPHKSSGRKMLPAAGRVFLSGARYEAIHSAIPDADFSRFYICAVCLKNGLGDIQADHGNFHPGGLL